MFRKFVFLFCSVVSVAAYAQETDANMGIIPAPVSVKKSKGSFNITPETMILTDAPSHKAIRFLNEYLRKNGYANNITDIASMGKKPGTLKNAIVLLTANTAKLPAEGYEMSISESQVTVSGNGAGLFYGVETLIQLIHPEKKWYATLPCGTIKDEPRFAWRGMHLDVSRHFFSVEFVKKYIDVLAMYKVNTFHWHLTDDQGWRIEIKKYPKLTEVASKRAQTKIGNWTDKYKDLYDNQPYGGFYTQEQIKEVVAYAAERFITIVPEIEMPGHSQAALAAYPIFSCDPAKQYKVAETWGVFNDVFCPTDTTIHFLEDVLDEVMDLFPGKYIHIGGDECPKDAWKASAFCQQLIKDSSLRDENGLQSYFVRRIERHLNASGRRMIGWDEILEGGLAPNATVMSWRGEAGGIAAAQLGHDVVMTPGSGGLYFDHGQSKSLQEPLNIGGNATLATTYNYEPIPQVLNSDQKKHIIGVQANLWTEYIATPAKVEFMLLPRLLALAEVAWTPGSQKNYDNFSTERLPAHLAALENKGYNYRVPDVSGISDTTITARAHTISLTVPVAGAKVHYTLDGFVPRDTDPWYTTPVKLAIPVNSSIEFNAVVITAAGKRSNVTKIIINNK